MKTPTLKIHKALIVSDLRVASYVSDNGKLFSGLYKAKKHRPKSCQGIIRCRPKNSEAVAMRSGAHRGLMCPLKKGMSSEEVRQDDPGG